MRRLKLLAAAIAPMALLVLAASMTMTMASPPEGVTPTLLARGTYDSFKVRSYPHGPGDFKAEAKAATDIVVRRHDYEPGSSTGWHTHPGPVFVTVIEGQVTFYEYDDKTCTPTVVSAGEGYVDTGRGHIGRNETGQPATDMTVIIAPVGGSFRGELDAPGPHCDF
jgi:quercetin dioxygenase-like cupin family protein